MSAVTTPSYSKNAQAAAATAQSHPEDGCPACRKAGLPLLLVRPGLAIPEYANTVASDIVPLLKGSTDSVELDTSGYVMRTLRAGYVYAYYETPHTDQLKAQKGWQVFRVSNGGYMMPYPIDSLPTPGSSADKAFACNRADSYATAMLFVIPDAKNTDNVWIGYSDHPWSKSVRELYAARTDLRDKRMTKFNAPDAYCESSVPMAQDFIETNIFDYALVYVRPPRVVPGKQDTPQLTASGRQESSDRLMTQAEWIVNQPAGNGYSIESAKIVGVPDPIGITAEAAQRRVALTQTANNWLAGQGEAAGWKLRSALSIDGLLKKIDSEGTKQLKAVDGYHHENAQPITRDEFDRRKKSGSLPAAAEFMPGTMGTDSFGVSTDDPFNGYISIPSRAHINNNTGDLKEAINENLNENPDSGWRTFLKTYKNKGEADLKNRRKLDADYVAWLDSDLRKVVTRYDYDNANPHDGMAYAAAVAAITAHGPLPSAGKQPPFPSAIKFRDLLTEDPTDPENLLVRAALGNQTDFFGWLAQAEQESALYGMIKTLFDLEGVKDALGSHAGLAKNIASGFASPILANIGATAAVMDSAGKLTPALRSKVKLLAGALMGTAEDAPPALLRVRASLEDIVDGWQAALGEMRDMARQADDAIQSRTLKGAIALEGLGQQKLADTVVDAYVWVRDLPQDIGDALGDGKAAAGLFVLEPAAANMAEEWEGIKRAVNRPGLRKLFRNSVTVLKSGDAALSVGGGILDLMVLSEAADKLETAQGEERTQAYWTLASSGLGIAATSFEVAGAVQSAFAKKAAQEAVETAGTRALAIGGFLGALGSAIGAYQSYLMFKTNASESDNDAASAQFVQSILLLGSAAAFSGAAIGSFLGAGSLSLLGLSLTGWGLILVAAGFVVGVIAMLLEDGPTAEWAAKCIWGKGDDKFGTLAKEQLTLDKIMVGVRFEFGVDRLNWYNTGQTLKAVGNDPLTLAETLNPLTSSLGVARAASQAKDTVSDVVLRLFFPASDKLPWAFEIVGRTRQGKTVVLARHAHDYEFNGSKPGDTAGVTVSKFEHDDDTIEQRLQVKDELFSGISATLRIYRSKKRPEPVVKETIRRAIGR